MCSPNSGSDTTKSVISDSALKTTPTMIETRTRRRTIYLARTSSTRAYVYINATKLAGIKLPAAKLIGMDQTKYSPSCTAVTAAAQAAVTSVYVVKTRFSVRLGDAFQTSSAKATRRIGTKNDAVKAISPRAIDDTIHVSSAAPQRQNRQKKSRGRNVTVPLGDLLRSTSRGC